MNGIQNQVDYWVRSSRQDLRVGKLLIEQRKSRHGLFFLHLAMEKLLKALVCKATQKPAPRIHSLPVLAERANLNLEPPDLKFLQRFDMFNLAARYPDDLARIPRAAQVRRLSEQLERVYRWLAKQL